MVNMFPQSVVCFQISYLDWRIVAMKCIFSPLCVSKCVFRCTGWLNVLSHCTHLWFFSPLWMSRCLFRFTTLLNDLLQSEQRCIFTPLCVSKWVFRCPASLNDLLHSAHLCDFSPLWMSMWVFRFTAWLNDLLHSEHICVTSPQCEWTYGLPVGWNIWLTWHTSCKDVSLLCPRSDLFSSHCLLTMTEESLSPLFIWSVRQLKKSTMYHFIMTAFLLDFSSLYKVYKVSSNRKNYVILQNIVIEYTIRVPSIHPGPISSKNNSSKT